MMKNKAIVLLLGAFVSLATVSCKEEAVPKPKSHLRLEYPTAKYKAFALSGGNCGYAFDV